MTDIATLSLPRRSYPASLRQRENVIGFLTKGNDFGFLKTYNMKSGDFVFMITASSDKEIRKLDRLCRHTVRLKIKQE